MAKEKSQTKESQESIDSGGAKMTQEGEKPQIQEEEPQVPLVPPVEEGFANLLKKFEITSKKGSNITGTIAENISQTGGEDVYEDPDKLAERLTTWHEYINPVKRKLILEHWFAEKGVPVPPEALRTAGMPSSQLKERDEAQAKEKDEKEKRKTKFFVDDTGAIRAAKDGETALTWQEAEQVADRMKKERGASNKGDEEPKFILDAEGKWQINPNAKNITGMDVLTLETVRKSQERGQPLDPFEVLTQRAGEIEAIRSVFGGGKEGGGLTETVETLLKLKQLTGTDEETKNLLAGIYKLIEKSGEPKENQEVKALRDEVKTLTKDLQDQEKQRLTEQINSFRTEIANLRGDLTKASNESQAKNEYGIMSEALKVVDHRLGAIEGVVRGVLGRPPGELPAGAKERLTQSIAEAATEETVIDNLAKEVFNQ